MLAATRIRATLRPHDDPTVNDEPTRTVATTRIPMLRPLALWPRRNARVAESLAGLARVDFVEFTCTKKSLGTQLFVLNVYLKRQPNRIPTNRSTRASRVDRRGIEPDFRLEKTLHDVLALRYHAWIYTQQQPPAKDALPCEYCAAFHKLTHSQYSHAKLLGLLWPSATHRKKLLEGFVNAMVACSVDALARPQRSHRCAGFANIPVRVERFLRRHSSRPI